MQVLERTRELGTKTWETVKEGASTAVNGARDMTRAAVTNLFMAAVLVAGAPQEHVIAENVDLIEVNHFHDENGKLVFDQVIFYDWSPLEGRYQVRAWRLLKASEQLPTRNWKTGDYSAVWHDGDLLRKLRAPGMRETFTQYDPELAEREYLPKEKRIELIKLTPKIPPAPTSTAAANAPVQDAGAMIPPQQAAAQAPAAQHNPDTQQHPLHPKEIQDSITVWLRGFPVELPKKDGQVRP